MATPLKVFRTSIGTKVLIAVTGLALFGYLLVHLAGNLIVFAGSGLFNRYAHTLISNPLVIPAEVGLLAILAVHIYKTVMMWRDNREARPTPYYQKRWAGHTSRKSVASTTMIYSGLITLLFVVVHLKNFKYGADYPVVDTEMRDLYRLEMEVFRDPLYVVLYVVSMVVVAFHLRHGISSAFQSLGVDHPRYTPRIRLAGTVLAIVIGGGFALIPIWAYFLGGR
ncbi:MAG: succinate dehydrogenase cytochrome b subunit [Acidobacteria bacterium]|nr:succinate dehydrogenase cytochrome b subunit [Acidobacteriota bacterium]